MSYEVGVLKYSFAREDRANSYDLLVDGETSCRFPAPMHSIEKLSWVLHQLAREDWRVVCSHDGVLILQRDLPSAPYREQ